MAVVKVAVKVSLMVEGLATQATGPLGWYMDLCCFLPGKHVPGGV